MYVKHILHIVHIYISLQCNLAISQDQYSSIDVPYRTLNAMSNHIVPTMLPDTEIHKVSLHEGDLFKSL